MILGIDFGTCFSTFAYMQGKIPVTGTAIDAQGIPTIFMNLKGKECFGEQCKTIEARRNRKDIIEYIKKEIRRSPGKFNDSQAFSSGGKEYSGKEIIKKILTYIIHYAQDQAKRSGELLSTEIEQITVTAPVGIAAGQMTASDYNQMLQKITMEITGLPKGKVRILEEPVAAAISFLESSEECDKNQTVLIFDLGGGTLDISAVERNAQEKSYTIIAKEGNLELGGNDWDKALEEYILDSYQDEIDLDNFESDEVFRFKDQIIAWKMKLSEHTSIDGVVRGGGERTLVEIRREDFERATKNLLDDAIETLQSVIQDVSNQGKTIDKIILVGGSCNMPQIRNRIVNDFHAIEEENILIFEPSKAIAKGAALYAKDLDIISKGEQETGVAGYGILNNLVSHTYGFESTNSRIKKKMIYNLLYKGTPLHVNESVFARSSTSFVALNDDQNEVGFTIYESDGQKGDDLFDGNWMELGSGEKPTGMAVSIPIPENYLGRATEYCCYPQFELTPDGILIFTVTDENGNIIGQAQRNDIQ